MSTDNPVEPVIDNTKMNIHHPDFLKPQRLEGETDYQYKVRRLVNKMYLKSKKKNLIWISKDIKVPVYTDPKDKNSKILGYTVSKGFSYNKKKVEEAVSIYMEARKVKEENQTSIK